MSNDPEKINYNAFQDDELFESKNNSNLKISNKQKPKEEKQNQASFDKAVIDYNNKAISIKEKISELTLKYKSAILDKTLSVNKSPDSKSSEHDLIKLLTQIASELNNDTSQPESIGSLGLNTLLLQICLIQRDQINELHYNMNKLNKLLNKLIENVE